MSNVAIKVEGVSKTFKLPHEKQGSVKSVFINLFSGKKTYEKQQVLNDVSFEIKEGEFFGIVGRNGSGKSTLLKLMAGIYAPDNGSIGLSGSLTPFIELGVGFNPELTGRENVYLNGALLGFNRTEMDAMYQDIVDFAEIEKFMDQKLKNYSSGMQVRLAFSIAIRAKSDILLLDEVLAVGDAAFQKKCLDHFSLLKKSKQTVVFVSHDMASMQKYCDRVAWIDKGKLKLIDKPRKVTEKYMEIFVEQTGKTSDVENKNLPLGIASAVSIDERMIEIGEVWLENEGGEKLRSFREEEYFFVKFKMKALQRLSGVVPGVIVSNDIGEFITASNTKWNNPDDSIKVAKNETYEVSFKMQNIFEKGSYKVSVNVVSDDLSTFYAWKNEVYEIDSVRPNLSGGKVNPKFEVEVKAV